MTSEQFERWSPGTRLAELSVLKGFRLKVPRATSARHDNGAVDTGLRAIMFTDLAGSTEISSREGDEKALDVLSLHDRIVRDALSDFGGREVEHTGDGIFASFSYVSRAVESGMTIHADSVKRASRPLLLHRCASDQRRRARRPS